jgi:hypothetical protein
MDDDFEFPADLQEIVSFRIVVGGRQQELFPYPPAALAGLINSSGDPSGYVVINDPTGYLSGVDYVMTYIQSIPALSDAAPQNWLILREPGLYLYGTLAHASPYLQDDNRALVWASIAKTMRESMKREDDNARYGNSPSQRIQGATP